MWCFELLVSFKQFSHNPYHTYSESLEVNNTSLVQERYLDVQIPCKERSIDTAEEKFES